MTVTWLCGFEFGDLVLNQELSQFRYLSRENDTVSTYAIESDRDNLKFITVEKMAIKLWSLESDNQLFLDFST